MVRRPQAPVVRGLDVRRALWHLRRGGLKGLQHFLQNEQSNVDRRITLDKINLFRGKAADNHSPLTPRVRGAYLQRRGLAVFLPDTQHVPSIQSVLTKIPSAVTSTLDITVYRVSAGGQLFLEGRPIPEASHTFVFHGHHAAIVEGEQPSLTHALTLASTPVISEPFTTGSDIIELSRAGYQQRIRTHVLNHRGGSISAVIATNRPTQLEHVVRTLASQILRPDEVIIGTHGFEASPDVKSHALELGLTPRWIEMDAEMNVGGIFGALISAASGTWIAKMDDDDFYGEEYLADSLWIAESTNADLAGKNASFAYLGSSKQTVLRFPGRELIETHLVAGPTLFIRRDTAIEMGYPDLPRSDDTRFVAKIKDRGGRIVAGSRFGFVYSRGAQSHVWSEADKEILERSRFMHEGMPDMRELPFGAVRIEHNWPEDGQI